MFVSWKSIIQPLLPHSSVFPGRSLVSIQFYSFYPKAQLFKGWIALSNEQIAIQWINVNKTYCAIHQITIYPLDNVIHFSNNKSVGKQRNYQREFSGLPKNNATSNIPQSLTSSWTLDLSIRSNALIIRVSPPSNDSAWNILRYLTYRAKQHSLRASPHTRCFNPFHPNISMQVLHTVLYTFLWYWQGEFA